MTKWEAAGECRKDPASEGLELDATSRSWAITVLLDRWSCATVRVTVCWKGPSDSGVSARHVSWLRPNLPHAREGIARESRALRCLESFLSLYLLSTNRYGIGQSVYACNKADARRERVV